ncbi:HAD family hydrolase [cf. Phormidesmis sp. LEGE 11477]|uniref:HAD family hydrolase n=1 Tax=cf. Phormidesmis sp. LEGE 11477 TaxID=1828680 RepID=UPI0018829EF2|nr:haloacid dehalogenase-like hydrolase [cf. Phormidesmis sp. LEGE 11477]MBE9061896.1 haloacid dehalogenase-like hydrolase [cf. Phormidesmis sp. LEGE 11477]
MTGRTTQHLCNRIAIAFDFDDTLAPDTFASLIGDLGYDIEKFKAEKYEPLKKNGWDGIPARFFTLLEGARDQADNEKRLTRSYLKRYGEQLQLFSGVAEMFDKLRQRVQAIDPNLVLEFYIISSGFADIVKSTSIAHQFKAIWGCDLHFGEDGEAVCLKHTVTHPDKVRYLYYLSRGIESHSEDDLMFVYQDVPHSELYIPLDQVIYVGDGTSDLPCFRLINQHKGIPIAVFPDGSAREWARKYDVSASQRVMALVEADYSDNSLLMQTLGLAVESMAKKIRIQQLGDRVLEDAKDGV